MKLGAKRLTALLMTAVLFFGGMPSLPGFSGTAAYAEESAGWELKYDLKWKGAMSVDNTVYHGDSKYSIKLTNSDYNVSVAAKEYPVERNTFYKLTAWVKYTDCKVSPDAVGETAGARIGLAVIGYGDGAYNGDWKKLEFNFSSDDRDTVNIGLYNGLSNAMCRGTAYFSDIRLEAMPWDGFCEYKRNVTTAEVDAATAYGSSGSSIKITNSSYNYSYVSKTLDVKKNTHYRASVMAKCSGYELEAGRNCDSGASIGRPDISIASIQKYNGTKWKRLYFEFDSGSSTEYTVSLFNGLYGNDCKGTVWYSDFRLEEYTGKPSNKWNLLVLIYKNVKAPVEMNGKHYTYQNSYSSKDIKNIRNAMEKAYSSVATLSDGLWGINSMDFVTSKSTLTKLYHVKNDDGEDTNNINPAYNESVSRELDSLIDKAYKESGKVYNQIVIIAPLTGVVNWAGLNGPRYNGTPYFQVDVTPGCKFDSPDFKNFHEGVFVHEFTHSAEGISRYDLGHETAFLDDMQKNSGLYQNVEGYWGHYGMLYSDMMTGSVRGGKPGINKDAFRVYNDNTKWKTVYGIENKDKFSKTDIASLTISKPKDRVYTGSAIKPGVTVKDGSRTLVKGKDYTLRYIRNKDIGVAVVIAEGKGKYTGKYAQTFRIVPAAPKLSTRRDGGYAALSWTAVPNAEKYEIYWSTDGGKNYTKLWDIDISQTSLGVKVEKGRYKFKIRACTDIYPMTFSSKFSNAVTG